MELPENIITGIDYLALFFELVGVVVISFGGFRALYQMALSSLGKADYSFLRIKKNLIQALVFGLDFFIIGDALSTLLAPDLDALILLILIVVIRTVLSVFLMKELKDEEEIRKITD